MYVSQNSLISYGFLFIFIGQQKFLLQNTFKYSKGKIMWPTFIHKKVASSTRSRGNNYNVPLIGLVMVNC